jgi:hypothetical protein
MKGSNELSKKHHKADAQMLEHLNELLQYIDLKVRIKEKQNAGEQLSEEEQEYDDLTAEQKERRNLSFNTKKSRFVERYLFPAMANLLTILEAVEYTQLRDVFDSDIRKLLFSVNKNEIDRQDREYKIDEQKPGYPKEVREQRQLIGRTYYRLVNDEKNIFSRLLDAILLQTKPDDFRLILLYILQRKIWKITSNASIFTTSKNLTLFHNIGNPDIGRAVSWIDYLSDIARASTLRINFNPNVKPVLF